jgi:hypothetical protein
MIFSETQIQTVERPKTLEDGLLVLADWFDAVYQDANVSDEVQQDCRRWAKEHTQLKAKLRELVDAVEWYDSFNYLDPWWEEYPYGSVQLDEIQKTWDRAGVDYQAAIRAAKE